MLLNTERPHKHTSVPASAAVLQFFDLLWCQTVRHPVPPLLPLVGFPPPVDHVLWP